MSTRAEAKAKRILRSTNLSILTSEKGFYVGWPDDGSEGVEGEKISPYFIVEADATAWVLKHEKKLISTYW